MPYRINCIVLLVSLLLALPGWSQQPEQYAFTRFRPSDGLASNIVNNVVQDSSGFIWVATNNGLQRFDGNRFLTFRNRAGDPTTVPSDEISQVYLDGQQQLWVMTVDNRIGIFDTRRFRYREIPIRQWDRETVYAVKHLVQTDDGRLLLHIRNATRLYRYDPGSDAFLPVLTIPFPPGWKVNYLLQDAVTRKYLMASDSGLAVYNPRTRVLGYGKLNPEADPLLTRFGAERYLNYLFIDKHRRLFFEQWLKSNTHPVLKVWSMQGGVFREIDLQEQYGLGYHQIKGLLQQQNGKLWLYGLPFMAEYNAAQKPLQFLKKDYNKERDLKFNQVFALYEDRQRNVWICTDYGIYLFNPDAQLFHIYTLTTPQRFTVEGLAQTALQLPNREIWIGYRDLGLFRYDAQFHPMPLPPAIAPLQDMRSVWNMHLHRRTGKLWIGMQGGTIIVYDTVTGKAQQLTPPQCGQRAVTQITEDRSGNIWLGTQGGHIVRWDHRKGQQNILAGFELVRQTGTITKMFADRQGYVWAAAIGQGLLRFDPANGHMVQQISKDAKQGFNLWNNSPMDIIQYNDSTLMVASGALNIINTRTGRVQHLSNVQGLPTNTVHSLARDDAGMLWLGTLNGLCRADLQKLSFTVYNQGDGLLNENFNVAGAHVLRDGRMLFTSAETFVVFNPADSRQRDTVRKPLLTDLRLMNRSLSVDSLLALKTVLLDYTRTHLVVEFSALNYNKLNKLDYYYQLENFDSAWIRSDDRHQAIYTFLPPGNYTFKLRTRNVTGDYSPEVSYLQIRVRPPFWKTWWFYLLLALALAAIWFIIDRERVKRLKAVFNMRSDIAGHLHHDVSTTLNNINVLSQIAKMKADKDIVRSKELIDEISVKSYNMMLSMDEILWSIDPANDSMEKTLLRISEFAQTLQSNSGTLIDIVVHEPVKLLRLDMQVRHDFFIGCKEALQELSQRARFKHIMVDIDLIRSRIVVKILGTDPEGAAALPVLDELRKTMEARTNALHGTLIFEKGKRDSSIVWSVPV